MRLFLRFVCVRGPLFIGSFAVVFIGSLAKAFYGFA